MASAVAIREPGWLNLPNALTLSRVGLGLACLWPLAAAEQRAALGLAFALMAAAEATDLFDGVAARGLGAVTAIGKILDPMADSMYRLTIFAAFVQNGWMPAWLMCVFILRDIGVSYLRIVAQQNAIPVAARFSGKAKAVAQGAAQLFAVGVGAFGLDALTPLRLPALMLAAFVTAYSLIDYAVAMLGPRPVAGKADASR